MRATLNRMLTAILMVAVMISMIFALSMETTFAASKAPTAPKITKATVYSNNNVKLQWSKSKNAVKYKVYRKKSDGKYKLVKTTSKRTYYSKNLAYGTKYTYKVKAVSKSGRTKTSKSKLAYTNPAKPVITVKVYDNNKAKVTWKKVSGAVKYKVYRKKADGKYVFLKTTTNRTYYSSGLSYGAKYTYKVKAISKAGKTRLSEAKIAYTNPAKPVITATVYDTNNVKVTWKKVSGAVKYKVYRKKADGKYVLMKTTTSLAYYNKDTAYETAYTYKVTAVSSSGKVNTSYTKKVTTGEKVVPSEPAVPDAPDSPSEPETPTEPDAPVTPDSPSEPAVPDCEKNGHDYQVVLVTGPTCTKDAYNEYKCSVCAATKREVTTPMYGHDWNFLDTVAPTYTEDGFDRYGCSRCHEYKFETIPKLENPDEPAVPSEPVVPDAPDSPSEPEKPAERTVTVKVPIYETDTVYWIKSYEGEIIFKSTDHVKWGEILDRPAIIIDGVEYDPRVTYGSGAFDSNGDGYEDEQYKIIVGYREYTATETEYYNSNFEDRIAAGESIIVIWND